MLLDRQLPGGGWNYGNTTVFGRHLYAQPDQTGLALAALRPHASSKEVFPSLEYLGKAIDRVGTPLSLGWGILGLGSWGIRPPGIPDRIRRCIDKEDRLISCNTQEISLLLAALSGDPWFAAHA
jgi:hypothetical protein